MALEEIKEHPKNPARHSQNQIEIFAKIIEYQGIRRPIRISKQSGYVTAGHGLLRTLRFLNQTHAPIDLQSYDSDEAEFADLVADNALAQHARLDLKAINLEVPNLGPDFDLECLGLKSYTLDAFERVRCPECGQLRRIQGSEI